MAALAHQIDNCPVSLSGLETINIQRGEFGTPQPAADENGDDGAVALRAGVITGNAFQYCCALLQRQPISDALTELLGTFDAANACG